MDDEERTEEEDRAEFEALRKQTEEGFYCLIGMGISLWAKNEGLLVGIAAMLLDTKLEKAGLVFYSISNFHTWLSIIGELFAMDSRFQAFRSDWTHIANRLKKLNDTRVRLAHHALARGKEFDDIEDGKEEEFLPALKPHSLDSRMKSRKHSSLQMEDLGKFISELEPVVDKITDLIDRMEPIFVRQKKELAEKIQALRQKLTNLTPAQIEALRRATPKKNAD
jgi:hypothetical protein